MGGADSLRSVDPLLLEAGTIRQMEDGLIPFGDNMFDCVVNNQVMEHVEDLQAVLLEIRRVLKPGGAVLSLFPDKGVWREGHCGIPFLHWFRKGGRSRILYGLVLRLCGLGYHKDGHTPLAWVNHFCEWLDRWTYYRSYREIHLLYGAHFVDINHIEDHWLTLRLGGKRWMSAWLPRTVQILIVRRLGGMVFVAYKVK